MFVDFNILNQLGSPSINSNTFANRPAAGQTGRLFVSTDTFEIYRDNGTTWDLIGGPGSSTITGTGTATQVAYFTSSQAIGSSSNLYWDNTNIRLGIGTSTPGTRLDIHGTGIMQHINATGATANSLMAFQRTGTNVWRLGDQYNGGNNFFEIHNIALANNAIQIDAATNKSIFTSIQNYVSGLARANYFDYTLNLPNGTTISSPNAVTTLGATLNLNIAGSATLPNGVRSGMDVFNGVNFTSAGTFTINQSSTIRAFSNLTSGWAFNGSAVGTITHLAGMRVLFPTNSGTAINVTTNYGLLINDQTANTGTITYTNRWGIYQEGASDLNYMAANLLLGSTVNTGDKLQVTGTTYLSSQLTVGNTLYVDTVFNRVGIGTTSPNNFLELSNLSATGALRFSTSANTAFYWDIGRDNVSTGDFLFRKANGGAAVDIMRIDNSGNLGLGVTPSGWENSTAFQVNNQYAFTKYGITRNAVYNAGYKYIANGFANSFEMNGGAYQWFTAVSGTAGNAITFTQPMTLTAGGNLLIGTTTDAGQKLQVNGNARFTNNIQTLDFRVSDGYLFMGSASTSAMLPYFECKSEASTIGLSYDITRASNQSGITGYSDAAFLITTTFTATTGNLFRVDNNGSVRMRLSNGGKLLLEDSVQTGSPTGGTSAEWKLGSRVAATVVLDTTQYLSLIHI